MFALNHRYRDTSPLPSDWLARITSTIARFWLRMRQDRHARLMSGELQALDDRMLKDIGLQRCQIANSMLNGRRDEWYVPLADMDWPAAPTPQARRAMPAHPGRKARSGRHERAAPAGAQTRFQM